MSERSCDDCVQFHKDSPMLRHCIFSQSWTPDIPRICKHYSERPTAFDKAWDEYDKKEIDGHRRWASYREKIAFKTGWQAHKKAMLDKFYTDMISKLVAPEQ